MKSNAGAPQGAIQTAATPRWTAYDSKFFDVKMPEGTKMQVQDRAYTSPIWYTP